MARQLSGVVVFQSHCPLGQSGAGIRLSPGDFRASPPPSCERARAHTLQGGRPPGISLPRLVASDEPLDRAGVEAAIAAWGEGEATAVLAAPDEMTTFIGESFALTDDFAPVDQLLGR